jgi:GT2 family glycosyltransferase
LKAPKVSIVISVFGQLALTQKCLACLHDSLRGKFDYEILITDDASEDETSSYLSSLKAPHRCFFNSSNKGFSINNNAMARRANGEFVLFLNNDAFVSGDWLTPMLNVFELHQDVGMVGNVQRLVNSSRFDHMGVVFGPGGHPRHYGQSYFHNPFKGKTLEWSAVTAACALVRRSTFLEVGGFDEEFINGCEDVELCVRMTQFGLSHYVAHDSVISHIKGASRGRKKYNQQNFEILMRKCGRTIRNFQSVRDQKVHARAYLSRFILRPFSINLSKLLEAFLIFVGLKKLPPTSPSERIFRSWQYSHK